MEIWEKRIEMIVCDGIESFVWKPGFGRPFRAWISFFCLTQGDALGYQMAPRWG
jgi:hypothetical protein